MHIALMLVLAVVPTVPAESFKCPRCTWVKAVTPRVLRVS
jgi:hypothetical protein